MRSDVEKFVILFMGAALAIVLGNSLYNTIMSLTDNILSPAVIKIFTLLGADTKNWDHNSFKVVDFLGDVFVFIAIVLMSYFMYRYMTKNNIKINPNQ